MSKKSCEAAESTEGAFCEWRGVNTRGAIQRQVCLIMNSRMHRASAAAFAPPCAFRYIFASDSYRTCNKADRL